MKNRSLLSTLGIIVLMVLSTEMFAQDFNRTDATGKKQGSKNKNKGQISCKGGKIRV